MEEEEKKREEKNYKIYFVIFITLLIISILWVIFAPMILTLSSESFDFTHTGEIGDTIGGIAAPVVGLLSAIGIYFSFNAQIQANKKISDQIFKSHQETNFTFMINELDKLKIEFYEFSFGRSSKGVLDYFLDQMKYYVNKESRIVANVPDFNDGLNLFDILMYEMEIYLNQLEEIKLSDEHRIAIKTKIWFYFLKSFKSNFEKVNEWSCTDPIEQRDDFSQRSETIKSRVEIIVRRINKFNPQLSEK